MARAPIRDHDIMRDRALDEAVAACRASGFRTFTLIWECDKAVHSEAYPDTAGVRKGLIDRLIFVLTGKFF